MKTLFTFVLLFFQINTYSQNVKKIDKSVIGKIEVISGMPIYMYAVPVDEYEIIGKAISFGETLKLVLDDQTPLSKKVEDAVKIAFDKKTNDKIADFDALAINSSKGKAYGVKFNGENSLKAYIEKVHNIPVFIYSKPVSNYTVVAQTSADFSKRAGRGLLHNKVKSMLKKAFEKQKNGEIGNFDAVIINPDDLSETFIKFKK